MAIHIDHDVVAFGGSHAVRLSNGEVELVVSTDFGPRILSYALRGGTNVLGFVPPSVQARPTPFGEPWHIYGGHRLWHAPEHSVRSYVPDNDPVRAHFDAATSTLTLSRAPERETSLVKELAITLAEEGTRVVVEHRIANGGAHEVYFAVWGLSVMALGGRAFVPSPPYASHDGALLPTRRIVTWPYTRLDDPRLNFGEHLVAIDQDPDAASPLKLGFWDAHRGWAAYAVDDLVFIKRFACADTSKAYADLGCNVEIFTDDTILELETLSPLARVFPGRAITHTETWNLFGGVVVPRADERAHLVLSDLLDGL